MSALATSQPCTGLLASVRDDAEAALALAGGADIIDLKDPALGALGAVADAVARAVVRQVGGRVPVSATTGDLVAMNPRDVAEAARRMAGNGVDLVKVGFFPAPTAAACVDALARVADTGVRLIAVFFGDLDGPPLPLAAFAAGGFAGVMIDTARKGGGSIRRHVDDARLRSFVVEARASGLLSGLAGSLAIADIEPLLGFRPDYLGFRGALCRAGARTGGLEASALARVRVAIPRATDQAPSRPMCARTALASPLR